MKSTDVREGGSEFVDATSGFSGGGSSSRADANTATPTASEKSSRDVVWLSPRGRRPVPLRYFAEGPFIYVISSDPASRWPAATLREGGCEVARVGGATESCAAVPVVDPAEAERARDGIQRKYGIEAWMRHYRPDDPIIRLDPRRVAHAKSPHERIRAEFDAIAPVYTRTVEESQFQRYLKGRTANRLVTALAGVDPLLEIGPGTGFETIPLLAAGHRIVAVDISEGMLRELASRARSLGVADRLVTRVAPLSDLGRGLRGMGSATFAAAYSTFGAFNLEPDVTDCAEVLGRLIRPGGRLIFTSLTHPGAAPFAWELILGHSREALARMNPKIPGGMARYPLDVHLRNPSFWDRALASAFERCDTRPVSILAPPFESPRLHRLLSVKGRRTARALDAALSCHRIFSPIAEWVLLTYRRRAEEGATTVSPSRASASH